MNVGDLLGSGTISGTEAGTHGSLLEMCQGGKVEIQLSGGEKRKFLQDGDTIIIRGWSGDDEHELIGFGECVGKVISALPL
jgi:fumarylacetoacetase